MRRVMPGDRRYRLGRPLRCPEPPGQPWTDPALIHGDAAPANTLICPRHGRAVLIDFENATLAPGPRHRPGGFPRRSDQRAGRPAQRPHRRHARRLRPPPRPSRPHDQLDRHSRTPDRGLAPRPPCPRGRPALAHRAGPRPAMDRLARTSPVTAGDAVVRQEIRAVRSGTWMACRYPSPSVPAALPPVRQRASSRPGGRGRCCQALDRIRQGQAPWSGQIRPADVHCREIPESWSSARVTRQRAGRPGRGRWCR